MNKRSFTLIEIIIVLVIIGILAMVAMPKFRGLTKNSKVSAELATASTIQSAIEDVHSEWVVNEGNFTWGNSKGKDDINDKGYPNQLGDCDPAFNWILKNSSTIDARWSCEEKNGKFIYRGPASNKHSGVNENEGKPDSNDCWIYDPMVGTFSLDENCSRG